MAHWTPDARRSTRLAGALLTAGLALLGCSETLEGPTPGLADPAPGRPAEPGWICGEQLTTPVTLHGTAFAPLVVGLPGDSRVVLPTVTLTHSREITGETGDGAAVTFDGTDAESTLLTWQSQSQMTLELGPDLALAPGLWDLRVVNPQDAQVEDIGPLAVAHAPELSATTPGITCVAQGPRPIVASGKGFLTFGGATARVSVGDADLAVDGLRDCADVPHPTIPGEICATADFTLPQDAVPPGFPAVVVHNPETAACDSEEVIHLRVVPPPAIERIEPPLACPVEGTREVTLHGMDFLTIDGVVPAVTMTLAGGEAVDLEVRGVAGCEAVETLGHAVERCTEVAVIVPQQAIDAPYKPTISLTNPDPAGCENATATALTLVPLPTLDTAAPPLACTDQGDREIRLLGKDILRVDGTPAAIEVAGQAVDVLGMDGCEDLGVDRLPTERCTEITVRVPEGHPMVDAGSFSQPALRIENPAPAGCSIEEVGPLTITPPPVVAALTPPVVCLEQGDREVVITGSGLLDVAGAVPAADVGGVAVPLTLDDCDDVPVAGLATRTCRQGTLALAQGAIAPGDPRVQLTNADPAGCASEEDTRLRVVPAPRITAALPPLACNAEGPREIVLEGEDFLTIDGALPGVTMTDADGAVVDLQVLGADGCEALPTGGADVQRCTRVTVVVPQTALAAPYAPTITLTNPAPAGCLGDSTTSLVLAPPPSIGSVNPLFLCRNAPVVTFAVDGADFLTVDGVPPAVALGDAAALAVRAQGCAPLEVAGLAVERCTGLEVDFAPEGLAAAESLTVTNPAPAGCSAGVEQRLVVLDPPSVRTVEPGLICAEDGQRQIVVEGAGFLRIDGQLPSVRIGDQVGPADSIEGCEPQAEGGLAWDACTRLTATLPQGALPEGRPLVEVIDPAPAGCAGGAEDVLTIPPPLTLGQVAPDAVCVDAGDRPIRVVGTGFLELDGVGPTLTIGGQAFAGALADCQPLVWPGHQARACTALTTTVPQGALPAGDAPVQVQNPDPSGCGERAEGIFFIVPVPEIDTVEPAEVCEADVETFTVRGRNFAPVSRVILNDIPATAVRFIDENTLEADFANGLQPGTYDATVTSADGCQDTLPAAVEVHPTPVVFFVDPPIAYNGINLQVTIYTTGLDAAPGLVVLLGPNGEEVIIEDVRPTPGRPNKILATVPAGLPVGAWTLKVESRLGCEGELPGALAITDDLRVGLTEIDPAFASPLRATAVTLRAEPADGEVGFASTPRAYLNPNPPDPDAIATALRAVVFTDPGTLTAVVPPGLRPGAYDVIVVNPDATVGLLEAGLTITAAEPPVVDAVEPASLDGNGPQVARIVGEDFDVAGGVTVAMMCRTPDGMEGQADAVVLPATLTPTSVEARFPADQFPAGSVCVITLTNSDGASARYSAVSIKTPAQNLNAWRAGGEMTTPRRALGVAAGRPTRTSRFLYAIGGDAGGPASALDTVEAAPVGIFGDLGDFAPQVHALPAPRTLAGTVRVGPFLYVVGGNDGATAVDTVLRARVLDPLASPAVDDLTLVVEEDAPGLGGGLWHYRIAAVFPADDPENPGGESLPGETTIVQIPQIAGLQITLLWQPVPGASGYRVYRTAVAGDGVDTVRLVAEVVEPRFTDAGAEAGDERPLPPGSLGVWHPVARLNTAREAAAVAATQDAGGAWLHVLGGRDAAGQPLATYEYTRITPEGDVGAFQTGADTLAVARAEGIAVTLTHSDFTPVVEGDTWIFMGPGRTGGATFSRAVEASPVAPDGSLTFIRTDDVNGDYAGYGGGAANGFLFVFGGRAGLPSDAGVSAELCRSAQDPGCGQAPGEPPDIRNWNNLGVRLTTPRAYMGSTQESAFFFVAGGTDGMAALTSIDQTVQ
ncbi:MAG: hypothetical protein H6706_30920 [Myxococcales bacterium]|nr:hypothetical protein [Myxococcales bacterium]